MRANSGNTNKCVPDSNASSDRSMMFCALLFKSPTIGLICAILIFKGIDPFASFSSCSCQNLDFDLLPLNFACSNFVLATTSAGLSPKISANSQACISERADLPELYLLKFD